jgi:hypothetical protein
VLVAEHNKVSAAASDSSQLATLNEMRAAIAADAKERNVAFPLTVEEISMKCKGEIATAATMERSAYYKLLKIAIVPKDSWDVLVNILQRHAHETKAKGSKGRKKGRDSEKPKEAKLSLTALEQMVQSVDARSITKILREVDRGVREWGTLKSWVETWSQSKSEFFKLFPSPFLFCVLSMFGRITIEYLITFPLTFLCVLQMWWTTSRAHATGTP